MIADQTFSGEASVNINVKGTPATPKISGAALLAGGTFEDRAQGILLEAIDAEVRLQPDGTVHLAALVKDAAEGTFAAEGQTRLGGQDPSLRLRAQAKHFAPLHRDDLNLIFSGIFGVSGPLSALNIHSSILLERGEVLLLSSLTGGSVPTLEISEPGSDFITKASGPLCDLTIDIPRRFFVRGRGLDSEWQGRLHIGGYLSEPQLTGSLKPVRGQFELLSRPFAFTGGDIAFAGGKQINPSVNLELTYETSALEAIIRTSGTLKKFALELESKPPYPRDEVLAQVLFGKNASALSRFEAVQLAAGLSELAGVGSGLNPLTAIRQATGLDVLRVGGGSSSQGRGSSQSGNALQAGGASQNGGSGEDDTGPSLEAGKYINDSIYIGVEQGVSTEDTAVRVEIELFPHVNLQGRTSPTSSQAGVGWKMDY